MGDLLRQTVSPGVPMQMGTGLFFKLIESTGPLLVRFTRAGSSKNAAGVEGGYQYGPLPEEKRFDSVTISSVTTQVVACLVGDEYEDYTRIQGLFTVVGNVNTMEIPGTLLTTPPRVATNVTTDTLLIAANPGRKKVTVQNPSSNADSANVGPSPLSTVRGIEIEPGASFEFVTTAALYARAVTGTPALQVLEES